jgi:hypothetical protein
MKDVFTLVGKDLKNSFRKKFFLLLAFLLLFQFWFVATSGSVEKCERAESCSIWPLSFRSISSARSWRSR